MSSTNRGTTQRVPNDYYATPDWLTEAIIPALLKRLQHVGDKGRPLQIFEPAAGDRRMVRVLERVLAPKFKTVKIHAVDLADDPSVDFLKLVPQSKYDLIITNPPFLYAKEFIEHALKFRRDAQSVVAMILRINFLGSKSRAKWLRDHRPAVYVTPRRPSFSANHKTDSIEYAWFLWQEPFDKNSEIDFLHTEELTSRVFRKHLIEVVSNLKRRGAQAQEDVLEDG